jgi:hypothetical protein
VPIKIRFSDVSPREVALVAQLRDMHRGTLPRPPNLGGVPEGPQEQAGRQRALVLTRSYIPAHTRTLKDGRTISIQPYFTKVIPKPQDPSATRRKKPVIKQPISGAYAAFTPEKIAQRLLRHVQEGTMTVDEARANLDHLERFAQAGHSLEHGHGQAWTPTETHAFIAQARTELQAHEAAVDAKRQEEEHARLRQQAEDEIRQNREQNDRAERLKQEQEERRQRRLVIKQKHKERQEQIAAKQSTLPPAIQAHVDAINTYADTLKDLYRGGKVWMLLEHDPGPKGEAFRAQRAAGNAGWTAMQSWTPVETQADGGQVLRTPEGAFVVQTSETVQGKEGAHEIRVQRVRPMPASETARLEATHQARLAAEERRQEEQRQLQAKLDQERAEQRRQRQEADRKRPRLPEELKLNAAHFKDAPAYILAAIAKTAPLSAINPKGSRGSHYMPIRKFISFRIKKHIPDYAGPVWRHEYGHHVDFEMGGGSSVTASVAAKAAFVTDREGLTPTAVFESEAGQAKYQEQVGALEATLRKHLFAARPAGKGLSDIPPERYQALMAQPWQERGFTPDDLSTILPNWGTAHTATHARLLAAYDQRHAGKFLTGLSFKEANGMVQDAVNAVSRNAVKTLFNHSPKYYGGHTQYGQMHATESYADWFCCQGAPEPVWRKLYAYFLPATDQAFKELTERWLTT